MKQIIIDLDNEHSTEITVKEVLRLIEEGYTSGIEPSWEIVEVENEKETE